ncbi:LOW QUALITY PROTEIN: rho GTPase-activating protein 26-like [Pomacea canaliculata]|uniref:LOW QUALITY PROTEIN: rho GTPase-activating protein 26-like n=1 Tax=Pomacea canaliculata TaxID=400727 RepID=UPI000D7270AA|nr:LOW QUALITY PROTEIN: rho GTPase-activating protein 26-like [Pomacea canaliculata]
MGLQPLEFADCLTDSPLFRTKLQEHERELERTSKAIKTLIHHGKQVFEAAKQLSKAQKTFAKDLREFNFECIDQQTDDEITIAKSLIEFSKYINEIEDLREKMIETSEEQFVRRLELFRKDNLGAAKEEKKNFDKQTAKFCQSQERYLNMKTRANDTQLKEADAQVEMEKRGFYQASMKYVLKLQEVQEKKKFEFVEILLGYMLGWLSFYHEGYEGFEDFKQYDRYLRLLLQKTRESFECTREQAERLMSKMLEARGAKPMDQSATLRGFTREGYLYLLEKRPLGTTWTKYYCQYKKDSKDFFMILFNQTGGKMSEPEQLTLESCVRRAADSIERRFCFDITVKERQGTLTFQALSDEDRRLWLDAMDGKEPIYHPTKVKSEDTLLDEVGFNFMRKGIAAIEARGLQEQGLYRVVGVNSKVTSLLKLALDPKKADKVNYDDPTVWETKTITSAIKNYLRSLSEPLMTFKLHDQFIKAASEFSRSGGVAEMSEENKMTVANLGVCFGPSLMRAEEETVAAIMDIKFCNIVVEILITNYEKIFKSPPEEADLVDAKVNMSTSQNMESSFSSSVGRPRVLGNHMTSSQEQNSSGGVASERTQQRTPPTRIYANQAPVHPSRIRPRPIQMYPANAGFDAMGSISSSTESLNSSSSKPGGFSPRTVPSTPSSVSSGGGAVGTPDRSRRPSHETPAYGNIASLANRFNLSIAGADSPAFGSVKKRSSNDFALSGTSINSSMHSSLTGSHASLSSSTVKAPRRTVITRYPCKAEHESELSFEANQMIHNVRQSREPGWLEGELEGRFGLIPENYVEFVDS